MMLQIENEFRLAAVRNNISEEDVNRVHNLFESNGDIQICSNSSLVIGSEDMHTERLFECF